VSYGGVEINSVLRCMNNECGKIVDRDINRANNIGSLFNNMIQGKERPEAFSRKLVADEKRSNR
jgi:transposase